MPPTIEAFTDPDDYMRTIDGMLEALRTAQPSEGNDRVLYPGLSEHEETIERRANGIPLHREVIDWFKSVTDELGLPAMATM